jgi:CxxC motif-containing protein (DUF1111 family)
MRGPLGFKSVIGLLCVLVIGISAQSPDPRGPSSATALVAQVVATGIPGAGAITQIGKFHQGGPFNDNAAFKATTASGEILDPKRIFVASTSNFGAPLAIPSEPPGSILSLDISDGAVTVPVDFAASGNQASAAGGKVRLYTAQSPQFLNLVNGNSGVTKDFPAVSLPLGISLNNGFGRPWFANAPKGSFGDGTLSVIDPNGAPLAGSPPPKAAGVFAGNLTNRDAATTHGMTAANVATALLTKSPDGSGRAVFVAALADGSVVQVHVGKGVDGLVDAASFTPLADISTETANSSDPDVITRVGMLFNWVPVRTVFVSDPLANRLLVFDLDVTSVGADTSKFVMKNKRYLTSPFLYRPVDLAPAVPEVAARNFASNTTLGGGSDLYVLNRGNNRIVRMTQQGQVVAVRRIEADLAGFSVNGIAVSDDARRIWVTATLPGGDGAVLQMDAFGSGPVTTSLIDHAIASGAHGAVAQGRDIFSKPLDTSEFVGPLFNGQSCASCHNFPTAGGNGGTSLQTDVVRFGRVIGTAFDPLASHGGPIARQRSVSELGLGCGLATGVPAQANITSVRNAMGLFGTAIIDNILDIDIEAAAAAEPIAVRGRVNRLPDGRLGRFGWKAQTATLVEFMGEAFRDEIGSTNPLAADDEVDGCRASVLKPEADAAPLTSLVAFLDTLDPPKPAAACLASPGAAVFQSIGCTTCHRPSYTVRGSGTNPTLVPQLFSDLLLHDMGALADGIPQAGATGSEFRTAPLWGVSKRPRLLHNGSASSLQEAISAHDGQGAAAAQAFRSLSAADQQLLLAFLGCI